MSFLGADTDELRGAADECMQGKEITDTVITYLQALIALLKAASFFSGGASAAYAEYLETVVVPWLKKISMALELFAKVLGGNADAQDQASAGESVNAGSIPTYTSQVGSGDSSVQPFTGSVLGSGNTGAAFGAITGAASSMGDSPATGGTQVTVTSPDGTVTTVNAGPGGATTAPVTTTPVTQTPISTPTTDSVASQPSALNGGREFQGVAAHGIDAGGSGSGAGAGSGGGGGGSIGSGGGGGGSFGGGGSVDSGSLGTGEARTDTSGATPVHSTSGGGGGGTPGADALTQSAGFTGDPVSAGDSNASSYGAAAGIAGGAGALGLGGAALAARGGGGGSVTGGADSEIDRIGAANGIGSRGSDVSSMQQRLSDAGYDTQGVDGKWGPNTQAAFDQYRADHPLPVQNGSGFTSPTGFDYNEIKGVRNNPNVTPEFLRQMEGVAQRTGAKPEHLMGVMSLETMGTFRPNIQNPDTHATGLIQFIPKTAEGLGTSTGELSRMTPTEQLGVVERYLSQPAYRGRVGTLEGLYSAVLPGRIMESDDVIFRPGTEAYRDNKWLDTDGTPGITLREAVDQVKSRMGSGAR